MPIARVLAVTVDCHDPARLAAFWKELVGGVVDERTQADDWVALRDVPVIGNIGFQKVPEGKSVKNRVHLDVEVDDIEAATPHVTALGATDSGATVDESTGQFRVFRDPEGNEFCLIRRSRAGN
jgi:predicted enzyme related to lactoylglutathione lyase